MKKIFLYLNVLFLLFTGQVSKEQVVFAEEVDLTITDMADREIEIKEPLERLVVLQPSDCEIIYELGAGDLIVGRGEYVDYPKETKDIPSLSTGTELNIEEIVDLEPDLVLAGNFHTPDQIKAMEKAGLNVFITDASSIEEVYTSIELLGQLLGKVDEADNLVEDMKETFDKYSKKAAELKEEKAIDTLKVYFEISPLEYGLWTAGEGTFMDEIASYLGLENVFSEIEGWQEVSQEQVIDKEPAYIITTSEGEESEVEEEILNRAGWESVPAVENKKVKKLSSDVITRPGPRLRVAIEDLFEFIYQDYLE